MMPQGVGQFLQAVHHDRVQALRIQRWRFQPVLEGDDGQRRRMARDRPLPPPSCGTRSRSRSGKCAKSSSPASSSTTRRASGPGVSRSTESRKFRAVWASSRVSGVYVPRCSTSSSRRTQAYAKRTSSPTRRARSAGSGISSTLGSRPPNSAANVLTARSAVSGVVTVVPARRSTPSRRAAGRAGTSPCSQMIARGTAGIGLVSVVEHSPEIAFRSSPHAASSENAKHPLQVVEPLRTALLAEGDRPGRQLRKQPGRQQAASELHRRGRGSEVSANAHAHCRAQAPRSPRPQLPGPPPRDATARDRR